MKKICKNCKREKELTSFYVKSNSKDGLQSVCKICTSTMAKEYRDKKKEIPKKKERIDRLELNIVGATKNDYCTAYSFLSKMGYNLEMDIHTQFLERWSLNVPNKRRKGKPNQYTYKDCVE